MADVNYPAGMKRILEVGLDNLTVRGLLLQSASDIDSADATVTAVLANAGTTELDDASYTGQGDDSGRRNFDNVAVSIASLVVNIDMDDEVWTSLDDANDIDGILLYLIASGDVDADDWVPWLYRDSVLDINGTNVTAVIASGGPIGIDCAVA